MSKKSCPISKVYSSYRNKHYFLGIQCVTGKGGFPGMMVHDVTQPGEFGVYQLSGTVPTPATYTISKRIQYSRKRSRKELNFGLQKSFFPLWPGLLTPPPPLLVAGPLYNLSNYLIQKSSCDLKLFCSANE